jgi:hypothetical protein
VVDNTLSPSDAAFSWDGRHVSFLLPPQEPLNTIPFGPVKADAWCDISGEDEGSPPLPFGPLKADVCDTPGEEDCSPPLPRDPQSLEDACAPPSSFDPPGEDEDSPPLHPLILYYYSKCSIALLHFYLGHTSNFPWHTFALC